MSVQTHTPGQVRLYKNSSHGSRPGSWELLSVLSKYKFTDSPEADRKPKWSLELDSGLAVLVVDCFCVYQKRFELAVDDSAYRLEFPATDLLQEFSSLYSSKLFENTHGMRDTPENRKKVILAVQPLHIADAVLQRCTLLTSRSEGLSTY